MKSTTSIITIIATLFALFTSTTAQFIAGGRGAILAGGGGLGFAGGNDFETQVNVNNMNSAGLLAGRGFIGGGLRPNYIVPRPRLFPRRRFGFNRFNRFPGRFVDPRLRGGFVRGGGIIGGGNGFIAGRGVVGGIGLGGVY